MSSDNQSVRCASPVGILTVAARRSALRPGPARPAADSAHRRARQPRPVASPALPATAGGAAAAISGAACTSCAPEVERKWADVGASQAAELAGRNVGQRYAQVHMISTQQPANRPKPIVLRW